MTDPTTCTATTHASEVKMRDGSCLDCWTPAPATATETTHRSTRSTRKSATRRVRTRREMRESAQREYRDYSMRTEMATSGSTHSDERGW